MAISDTYQRIPCAEIKVARDARQRREFSTTDLEPSITRFGVLTPIIVDSDLNLIAGERRLTTSIKLGLPDIPVRFISDLTPSEAQIIELVENLKRVDLSWQDSARSIAKIHDIFSVESRDWNYTKTANEIGVTTQWATGCIRVARALADPRIAKLDGMKTAINMLTRMEERKTADVLADIAETTLDLFGERDDGEPEGEASIGGDSGTDRPQGAMEHRPSLQPAQQKPESILCEDFISWANTYSGPPFNFLHCDFPYGVNLFAGKWSGRETHTSYSDSPDTYWNLCLALFSNLDKLMGHSGHIMFWFSMDYYTETMNMFESRAPSLVMQKRPLVWHKTDNTGIVPDPSRGPRYIYETALIGSREDRKIVKTVANVHGSPVDKKHHTSTKPEPMLRHFFQMFVDENTKMLDPTCGSASSLRAAESLGAVQVLGLELDPTSAVIARGALKDFRNLRAIAGR